MDTPIEIDYDQGSAALAPGASPSATPPARKYEERIQSRHTLMPQKRMPNLHWAWKSTLPKAASWSTIQAACPQQHYSLKAWNFCGSSLGYTTHNSFAKHLGSIWMSMRCTNKLFNQFLPRGVSWSLSYRRHTGHNRAWLIECSTITLDRLFCGCLHLCIHTNLSDTNCL